MFMFRKKVKQVSTTTGLQKEAKRFQNAVTEINANYKPNQLDISLVEGVAKKYNVEPTVIAEAFETYLKNNALSAIRKVKAGSDYSVLNLEQAALAYGYELDDLNVTYFSVE